jgi:hypothetical protein
MEGEARRVVCEAVGEVAREHGFGAPIEDRLELFADLRLPSLEVARLIAVLEAKLGVDPFLEMVAITDVRTVGDLVRAYEAALGAPGAASGATADDELRRAAERGAGRRDAG